jgi:hypothetical protein
MTPATTMVGSAIPYAIFLNVTPVLPSAGETAAEPVYAYTTTPTMR